MEPHKALDSGIEKFRPSFKNGPNEYFRSALEFARNYYQEEIDRISSVNFEDVTPEFFYREYIWVVHATGFSAKAVGSFMPRLLEAYGPWDSLGSEPFGQTMDRVKGVCNNPQKSKAIHATASLMTSVIRSSSWDSFKKSRLSTTELLSKLPYIGKITCFHLGRNIGLLECVKPDLHLVRMAEYWGFKNCDDMCESMRESSGETLPLGIIDLVLWYAASTFGTIEIRKDGQR